jgi:hypothetical protein
MSELEILAKNKTTKKLVFPYFSEEHQNLTQSH